MIERDEEKKRLDNLFEDLLVDSFILESRSQKILDRIGGYLQEEGINAQLDGSDFATYVSRISNLQLLNLLTQGLGLGQFRDRIMENEIDRLFPSSRTPNEFVRHGKRTSSSGNSDSTDA